MLRDREAGDAGLQACPVLRDREAGSAGLQGCPLLRDDEAGSAGLQACRRGSPSCTAAHVRSSRPRLDHALYVGRRRCFLTFCTHQRQRLFARADTVDQTRDSFLHAAISFHEAIVAYCFMPDHAHLLVEGLNDQADALGFVHQAKQKSGYAYSQKTDGRSWQPSFYDRILRDDDDSIGVTRYIFENPIRAGLATSVRDYPHLGSGRYTIDQVLEAVCWQP